MIWSRAKVTSRAPYAHDTQPLVDMLAAHLKVQQLMAADADQFVFVGSQGRPLQYSGFRQRVWLPACRAVDLPDLGFHDLSTDQRHRDGAHGVDVKTAQARLGHSDPRLTLGVSAQATTRRRPSGGRPIPAGLLLDPSEAAAQDDPGMEGA